MINDVIQAFLMPAGLVYAIAFGFALQSALQSQESSLMNLGELTTLLRQSTALIERMNVTANTKMMMFKALKTSVVCWMKEIVEDKMVIYKEGMSIDGW